MTFSILRLDEPTSGLDYRSMILVGDVMKKLAATGVLLFNVTHDNEFIENVCSRIIQLEKA